MRLHHGHKPGIKDLASNNCLGLYQTAPEGIDGWCLRQTRKKLFDALNISNHLSNWSAHAVGLWRSWPSSDGLELGNTLRRDSDCLSLPMQRNNRRPCQGE